MPFDVRRAREDLPAARAHAYLNAGTFGPLPAVAAEAMRAHLSHSFEAGRIGHAGIERWARLMDGAREGFARAIGASAAEIALMHATTEGINAVVWGLGLRPGDEVVTTTDEHPGLTAPLEELSRVHGVVTHAVPSTLDAIVGAIGSKTRLVALSHVLWTSGEVLPIADVARAAHAVGALVLVDGAQSGGAIDVRPEALGADFYTLSGQKWLCGPSGTGALWVRPSVLGRLRTPWPWYLSRSRGPAGVRDWPDARRLDAITLSMTSLAGIGASLAWHCEQVGQGALVAAAERARSLRERLGQLPKIRLAAVATPSTLVSFEVRGTPASEVTARLERGNVLVRSIPGRDWVRASIGFWNDEADLDRLVSALSAI